MPTSNFAAHEAEFKKAFIYVTNFALRMQWYGACHATTAVMFCVAKKLGIDNGCRDNVPEEMVTQAI